MLGLPGLSGNIKNFDYLGERIGGDALQLVALDWRGRGKSEQTPAGSYGWENHARDALAVADAFGFEEFGVVGQSMGGSVAMKIAELDSSRLNAVVLVDVAGRVDRGVGDVIAASIGRLGNVYDSVAEYLQIARSQSLVDPWSDYWDRATCYELEDVDGGVRTRTNLEAVAEDRAYTMTQDPYRRWKHLTMPTLLVRANQELRQGSGYVVPLDDRDRFLREVADAAVVEIDGNHLSINTHPDTVGAIHRFLTNSLAG